MNCSVGKKAVAFGIFKFAHTPALNFTCSNGSYVFEIPDDHFAISKFTLGVIITIKRRCFLNEKIIHSQKLYQITNINKEKRLI